MVFEENQQGIILRVRLTPNSSCCKVNGVFTTPDAEKWLKISVVSVPEKGRANLELIRFLAKELKVAKSMLKIISGETDRYKKVLLPSACRIEEWLKENGNDGTNSGW